MQGVVFYNGPSVIDGKPIVAIATTRTRNRKTGDMLQTWILRSRIDPVRALQSGGDASICGGCYHRGTEERPRTCYVNVGQAPLAVYHAFKRGSYQKAPLASVIKGPVRMGAYGDPAAVPIEAWAGVESAPIRTGYTHQWRQPFAEPFRKLLMASCDSPAEAIDAARAGWRSFLIRSLGSAKPEKAIECPADTHGTQCSTCGLCQGAAVKAPSIFINAHGTAKRFIGNL